jgi:ribonuclease P protein component
VPEEKKVEQHFQHKMLISSKGFSFCYLERLHTSADFNNVLKNGKKLKTVFVNVYVLKRKDNNKIRRLGLITSRKIGKAVIRNTAKRRLREIFRTNKHKLTPGLDIIFILKPQITSIGYSKLKSAVLDCLESAKFYNNI